MLCTNCKKEQATFFYSQTINGKESSAALCAHCAKHADIGAMNFLSPLFQPDFADKQNHRSTRKTCSLCGLTFADIQKFGKVGCPDCYKTFRDELQDTIRSIHGSTKYIGSAPADAATKPLQSEEEKLRTDLTAAIQTENYEEAARLRDAIKALKGEK